MPKYAKAFVGLMAGLGSVCSRWCAIVILLVGAQPLLKMRSHSLVPSTLPLSNRRATIFFFFFCVPGASHNGILVSS